MYGVRVQRINSISGRRVLSLKFVVFLQLLVSTKFATAKPVPVVSQYSNLPNMISHRNLIDVRAPSLHPQSVKIRDSITMSYDPTPPPENLLKPVEHVTAKEDAFSTRTGQGALLASQTALTAFDPEQTAYETAQNLYSTIDSIKSLVGMLLDGGAIKVEIWKFEDGEPSRLHIPDSGGLASNKCYVMTETRSGLGSDEFSKTYYWIGRDALDTDAADAASFAVQQNFEINSGIIDIHKEAEGRESHAFKKLLKDLQFRTKDTSDEVYENRMFLISRTDDNKLRFKEAFLSLGLHYAYNIRNLCMVFVSKELYVCCGMDTSEAQRLAADELAQRIAERTGLTETITIHRDMPVPKLSQEQKDHLLQLFAALNRTPKTISKNQPLQIYRIEDDLHGTFQMEEEHVPLSHRSVLDPRNCFILDSCSPAGIFVWAGKGFSVQVLMESARRAELLLRTKNYDNATPITFINYEDVKPAAWTFKGVLSLLIPRKYGKDHQK